MDCIYLAFAVTDRSYNIGEWMNENGHTQQYTKNYFRYVCGACEFDFFFAFCYKVLCERAMGKNVSFIYDLLFPFLYVAIRSVFCIWSCYFYWWFQSLYMANRYTFGWTQWCIVTILLHIKYINTIHTQTLTQ